MQISVEELLRLIGELYVENRLLQAELERQQPASRLEPKQTGEPSA